MLLDPNADAAKRDIIIFITLHGVRAARNFNSNNKRRAVKMRFKSARKLLKNIMIKLTEGVPARSPGPPPAPDYAAAVRCS